MKTNLLLVLVTFVSLSVIVYTFAYENGRQAGLADVSAARTAVTGAGGATAGNGAATPSGTPGAFGRGAGGATGSNPGGAAGTFPTGAGALFTGLQGTVDKVDGNTLTVSVTRGQQTQTLKVTLGVTTTVQMLASGAIGDVKPGARVLIGAENLGGGGAQGLPTEVNARSITILPANTP